MPPDPGGCHIVHPCSFRGFCGVGPAAYMHWRASKLVVGTKPLVSIGAPIERRDCSAAVLARHAMPTDRMGGGVTRQGRGGGLLGLIYCSLARVIVVLPSA